jgi:hypothetical protein
MATTMNWEVLSVVEGFIIGFLIGSFVISWFLQKRFSRIEELMRDNHKALEEINASLYQLLEPMPIPSRPPDDNQEILRTTRP